MSQIPVKISSDAGEASPMTQVFVQNMDLHDLVERMLGYTGKDPELVRQVLSRGSFVSGATRMRWDGFAISQDEVALILKHFPSADPERAFDVRNCIGAQLLEGRIPIEIPSEAAAPKRLLRRKSFWDVLMQCAVAQPLEYVEYSYRLRSDRYRRVLLVSESTLLKEQTSLLTHAGLAQQIAENDFRTLELLTHR